MGSTTRRYVAHPSDGTSTTLAHRSTPVMAVANSMCVVVSDSGYGNTVTYRYLFSRMTLMDMTIQNSSGAPAPASDDDDAGGGAAAPAAPAVVAAPAVAAAACLPASPISARSSASGPPSAFSSSPPVPAPALPSPPPPSDAAPAPAPLPEVCAVSATVSSSSAGSPFVVPMAVVG